MLVNLVPQILQNHICKVVLIKMTCLFAERTVDCVRIVPEHEQIVGAGVR